MFCLPKNGDNFLYCIQAAIWQKTDVMVTTEDIRKICRRWLSRRTNQETIFYYLAFLEDVMDCEGLVRLLDDDRKIIRLTVDVMAIWLVEEKGIYMRDQRGEPIGFLERVTFYDKHHTNFFLHIDRNGEFYHLADIPEDFEEDEKPLPDHIAEYYTRLYEKWDDERQKKEAEEAVKKVVLSIESEPSYINPLTEEEFDEDLDMLLGVFEDEEETE